MSGIYGIFRYDGAPVDPSILGRMKAAMAPYGPDGASSGIEGPVGMGHLLLELNPEDSFEKQPVRGERGLIVTAARLDNRESLLGTFNISASQAEQLSDGHLVSMAFDRWGQEVCTHLEGDWALAAWDAKECRLILARDVFGNAPLYYHQGDGFLAFASSMKALLALDSATKKPDLLHLAGLLLVWIPKLESTAYEGYRSVAGAHAVSVNASGQIRSWNFWSPVGRQPLRYRNHQDYADEFLQHYDRAVRSCLRTRKPVTAELSGGRDSGSVVTLAAPILAQQGRNLTAFTSVPLLPADGAGPAQMGNEWDMAHATAEMAGDNVKHCAIDAKEYSILASLETLLDIHNCPTHVAANMFWSQAIIQSSVQLGARALLAGQLGNYSVSWEGNGSAALALLEGQPSTAGRLLLHAEPNPWLTLKRQILKPLLLAPMYAVRRRLIPPRKYWQSYSAINPAMAEQMQIDERMRADGHDASFRPSPLWNLRYFMLRMGSGTSAASWSEMNLWHSLVGLDPTANLALIEFLLRVPDDEFYSAGKRSRLFKRAFTGRMPDAVVNPQRMGLQSADLGHRILREKAEFEECLRSFEAMPAVREFLNMPLLHRCLNELTVRVDKQSTQNAQIILVRGIGVGLFLRRFGANL